MQKVLSPGFGTKGHTVISRVVRVSTVDLTMYGDQEQNTTKELLLGVKTQQEVP